MKHITFIALLACCSLSSLAQSTNEPAGELNSVPPVVNSTEGRMVSAKVSEATAPVTKRKISYGLTAGTQYSGLYGVSTFLEPSILFPVTKRFSGYAGLSFVNNFGFNSRFTNSEMAVGRTGFGNQRYILNVGGNYIVNERLNLTGSVWRDLSKNSLPAPINLYYPGGTSGLSLRANYKITEHLSVSGGLRVSNGNSYNNYGFNPANSFGY